jgi:tRNA-binding protein
MITWDDFMKVEMRAGTVIDVKDFPDARNPSYQIWIDFGELGVKKTSAQVTKLYDKEDILGRQVIAVVNFPPKQIANFMSECLVMGVVGDDKEVTLLSPDRGVRNGLRVA